MGVQDSEQILDLMDRMVMLIRVIRPVITHAVPMRLPAMSAAKSDQLTCPPGRNA